MDTINTDGRGEMLNVCARQFEESIISMVTDNESTPFQKVLADAFLRKLAISRGFMGAMVDLHNEIVGQEDDEINILVLRKKISMLAYALVNTFPNEIASGAVQYNLEDGTIEMFKNLQPEAPCEESNQESGQSPV